MSVSMVWCGILWGGSFAVKYMFIMLPQHDKLVSASNRGLLCLHAGPRSEPVHVVRYAAMMPSITK